MTVRSWIGLVGTKGGVNGGFLVWVASRRAVIARGPIIRRALIGGALLRWIARRRIVVARWLGREGAGGRAVAADALRAGWVGRLVTCGIQVCESVQSVDRPHEF